MITSSPAFDRNRAALQIQSALPPGQLRNLLIAATLAGAAIPSSTLQRLGISIPFDWRALNRFQSAYPISISSLEAS